MGMAKITGPIYGAAFINNFQSMSIVFELSRWDQEEDVAIIASGPTSTQVASDGSFEVDLFVNADGVNNTKYYAYVEYARTNGTHVREQLGYFTLVQEGTFKLADLAITSEEHVEGLIDVYSHAKAVADTSQANIDISQASADAAATSASEAATSALYLRNLNMTVASNVISGDIDTTAKVDALNAAMLEFPVFIWDRTFVIPDRTVGAGKNIFNIPSGLKMYGETDISIDMSAAAKSGTDRYVFGTPEGAGPSTPITVQADKDDDTVTIGAAAIASLGLTVGSAISIHSDRVFIAGGSAGLENQGERSTVVRVNAETIEVSPPLRDTYALADNPVLSKLTMNKRNLIEGVRMVGPGMFTADVIGDRGFNLIHMDSGFQMTDCAADFFDNGNYIYSSDGIVRRFNAQFESQPATVRTANQYGLCYLNSCQDLVIEHSDIKNGKHGIIQSESGTALGVTRGVRLLHNKVSGTHSYAIATHTHAEFLYFENNRLFGCNGGFEFGCKSTYSKSNQVHQTPDANGTKYGGTGPNLLGMAYSITDIADNINSTGDKAYGGRYGLRLSELSPIFAGSEGPRNINVENFYCENAANAAVSIKSDHTGTKGNIHLHRVTTRDCGAASYGQTAAPSIEIDGDWEKVSVTSGSFEATAGNVSACVVTANVQDAHVTENNYSVHAAPSIAGAAGATIVTRNNTAY